MVLPEGTTMTQIVTRERATPLRDPTYVEVGSCTLTADVLWKALVGDSASSVLLLDADGRVLYCNGAGARIHKCSPEEAIGRNYRDLVPVHVGSERLALLRRVVETGTPMVIENMLDGVRRRTSLRPMPSKLGEPTRVLMVCRPAFTEPVRETVIDAEFVKARARDLGPLAALTPRELEILTLIGQGLATADIAKTLGRSEKTIEWHRVSLGAKLNAPNRVELAKIAYKSGLIPEEHEPDHIAGE